MSSAVPNEQLNDRYEAALRAHIGAARPDVTLAAAYDLGREAIDDQLGVLDLVEMHERSCARLLGDRRAEDALRTSAFLLESLAPFEMIHRGFRDANERLQKSESRYRELIDNAADPIATVDRDLLLTGVNKSFEQILGYSREELLGTSLLDLVTEESRERVCEDHLARLAGGGDAQHYEHDLLARHGRRVTVEVASRAIEEKGEAIGVQTTFRDLSERRHLEQQLRQAQRLESVGLLAGGIAHDFNNLLTVIRGNAQLLLEDQTVGGRPEVTDIAAAATRAETVTRQLLAFSRQQVLEPRVIALNDVIEQIAPMLRRLIGEDIELEVRLDPALAAVLADPGQIEQVLVNLVVNARDAMPGGGQLTIETANVELGDEYLAGHPEARPGWYAMLAVTDAGIGMDRETVARMFDPFFTTKAVGSGTGLGLATTYGIVKQSGGSIGVYSEVGEGTSIKVYLPATAKPVTPSGGGDEGPDVASGRHETVLVVEDDESVRKLTVRMLERYGYAAIPAVSPSEALNLAAERDGPIDLVLTDLVMRGGSGQELAQTLRLLQPGVRVLFMSGYASQSVARNGDLVEGAGFIQKPFVAPELARKIREALDAPWPVADSPRHSP